VQVVKQTYVAVDIPVQRQGVDCLPATGDAVRRTQLVVQIDRAEASCNLERSPAPAIQGKTSWQERRLCRRPLRYRNGGFPRSGHSLPGYSHPQISHSASSEDCCERRCTRNIHPERRAARKSRLLRR
jgi:hypothetical protein